MHPVTSTTTETHILIKDHAAREARLREELLRYLRVHSRAGDTSEGILASWLPKHGFEDAPEHIEVVLKQLVSSGYLRPHVLADGKTFYERVRRR